LNGYWDAGRKHLDEGYVNIKPSYPNVERHNISMSNEMNVPTFMGYLGTWSGLNAYRKAHPDREDPLIGVRKG
jgi:hypothetical protein